MYSRDRLLILDADGTTIDAFGAIERTFAILHMNIGDLDRFQKRRHLFKYLGGIKEFPSNLKRQLGKRKRSKLISTLTEIYREEAVLYERMGTWINHLIDQAGLRVGVVTRNITNEPVETLRCLFERHGVDTKRFDFLIHIPLKQDKVGVFRQVRESFRINPARAYACGDEKQDFLAALSTGMHPFMVSYGFEDLERLTGRIGVPIELVSLTPMELRRRVCHALDVGDESEDGAASCRMPVTMAISATASGR